MRGVPPHLGTRVRIARPLAPRGSPRRRWRDAPPLAHALIWRRGKKKKGGKAAASARADDADDDEDALLRPRAMTRPPPRTSPRRSAR